MINLFQAAAESPCWGLGTGTPQEKVMFTMFVQLFLEIINAMIRGVSKVQLLGEV